jgi:hypothetical protein
MASLLPMTGPPGRSGWSSSSASTTSVRWFESSDTRSSDTRGAQEFRHPRSPRVQTPAIPKGLPDTHRLRLGCQTPTVSHRLGCQTPTVWRGGILIAANHSEFGCLEPPANHSEFGCLEPPANHSEFGCLEPLGVWVSGTPRQSLGVWVSGTPGVWVSGTPVSGTPSGHRRGTGPSVFWPPMHQPPTTCEHHERLHLYQPPLTVHLLCVMAMPVDR